MLWKAGCRTTSCLDRTQDSPKHGRVSRCSTDVSGLRALEGSFRRKTKKEKESKTGVKKSKAHPPYSCEITPALPGLKAKIRLTKLLMTPALRLEILPGAWPLYEEPASRSRPLQLDPLGSTL